MTQFVTVDEAVDHLRIDNNAMCGWLDLMITAITQSVIAWLKDEWRCYEPSLDSNGEIVVDSNGDAIPYEDEDGFKTVKPQVKAAVLVELALQDRYRDGSGPAVQSHWGHGYTLGPGATNLLSSLRKSTVV